MSKQVSAFDQDFTNGTIGARGSANGTIGANSSANGTISAYVTVNSTNGTIGSRKTFRFLWSPFVTFATNGTMAIGKVKCKQWPVSNWCNQNQSPTLENKWETTKITNTHNTKRTW